VLQIDVLKDSLSLSLDVIARKLVAFASDGASVMLGRENGVAAVLRQIYAPFLNHVHCFAHCGHVSRSKLYDTGLI
jgi:hypothetical protein